MSYAFVATLATLVTLALPAQAYIGPGIAVTLAAFIGWPLAILAGLVSILFYYPLRYLYYRFVKKTPVPRKAAASAKPLPPAATGDHGGKNGKA